MLNKETIKKINDYVYKEPRTIQEISQLIKKNWRTADSYVEKIKDEEGTLTTKTFRGGTKGALKIVYWNNIEKIHSNSFQERLFSKIENAKDKEDFSPFELFQHIEENKRHARAWYQNSEEDALPKFLRKTEKELLCFSGNLSWINAKGILKILEELLKHNTEIRIISRIDIASIKNIQRLIELENKLGKKLIDIRHSEQPLRGFIQDSKITRLTEIKDPNKYRFDELKKQVMIDYEIKDPEWNQWLEKVFFNMFRNSIGYEKRIKDLKTIEKLEP
jgi:hypothetical protein